MWSCRQLHLDGRADALCRMHANVSSVVDQRAGAQNDSDDRDPQADQHSSRRPIGGIDVASGLMSVTPPSD